LRRGTQGREGKEKRQGEQGCTTGAAEAPPEGPRLDFASTHNCPLSMARGPH
jgi:hypothetical protein